MPSAQTPNGMPASRAVVAALGQETAHCARRYMAPAQMRSRCVGRGDASRAIKPRGTQRRTERLCGDESAVSTARESGERRETEGVRRVFAALQTPASQRIKTDQPFSQAKFPLLYRSVRYSAAVSGSESASGSIASPFTLQPSGSAKTTLVRLSQSPNARYPM